ncbi:MAG: hypothetical protein NVS2B3_12620 [Vulcanimicrobiaceae bacterium]
MSDIEASSESLQTACVLSISSLDLALEAEVESYRGFFALGIADFDSARNACKTALEIASQARRDASRGAIIPLDHVVARTHELLGVIEATDGHYAEQLVHARRALQTLDRSAVTDVYQEAFALRNLTILARDFDIAEDARMLAARVPSLAWTNDIRRVEFTTVEALGWCSALRGDSTDALRSFRRAAAVATSDPERILIGVDRALIAREFGHRPMVVEEVEHALDLADAYNWNESAGDYRVALLTLAQVAAPIAPARARQTLERYTAIRNAMDAAYAARLEPRARAEEAYTHGLVLRAEGRTIASTERLTSAFETWESIGYEWRAARAALELTELGAGEVFRFAVRRDLSHRPDSIFSARARLVA